MFDGTAYLPEDELPICESCHGSGDYGEWEVCPECQGSGVAEPIDDFIPKRDAFTPND